MQVRRQNGQTQKIIMDYNGFLCKTYELEIGIKLMNFNLL